MQELGELVGLMDMVKDVELPRMTDEEVGRLLAGGVGSVEFDGADGEDWEVEQASMQTGLDTKDTKGMERSGKSGRELLEYATNRRGDYYMSRKSSAPPNT